MEEGMYVKGLIILEPIKHKDIVSGTMGIVDSNGILDIVTVEHITQDGFWWVDGSTITGELSTETDLNKVTVIANDKKYPLRFGHWKKVIKHRLFEHKGLYNFQIVPLKFRKGKYSKECIECHAHYTAAKSQHICYDCCVANAYALLKDTITTVRKKSKSYTESDVKSIAVQSYELGRLNYSNTKYDSWLNKIVDNYGTNRIKNKD